MLWAGTSTSRGSGGAGLTGGPTGPGPGAGIGGLPTTLLGYPPLIVAAADYKIARTITIECGN